MQLFNVSFCCKQAQERLVMKLTDALQIQLGKQNPVDPKNVRPASVSCTSFQKLDEKRAYAGFEVKYLNKQSLLFAFRV